jgi:predicted  nucleic acid-binding Zn-ribbon protein
MFQRFLKARSVVNFKARSASRDTEADRARVTSIFRSIEEALEGARTEQAGLKSRIDDALARSAVTLGNDSDEYLTRDPEDNHYQNLLGTEIAEGQRRLNELEETIRHIQFLKTALVTRFPDFDFGDKTSH